MALAESGPAPYAPAATVLAVIDRYREVGFQGQPITAVTLQRVQITESLIPRTLAALRLLDLIDPDGRPTPQFDTLRNARPDEFNERLGEWLRDMYAPIFGHINPAEATAEQIEHAFWGYEPAGQRARMATLFIGLAVRAGLIPEAVAKPRGRHATKRRVTMDRNPKVKVDGKADGIRGYEPEAGNKTQPPTTLDAQRQRYVELLIAKLETQDSPDADLFDRIEHALGIAARREPEP